MIKGEPAKETSDFLYLGKSSRNYLHSNLTYIIIIMQDKFNINVTFLAKAAKHISVTENKKFEFPSTMAYRQMNKTKNNLQMN